MVKLWQSPAYLTYVQPELTDELVSKFEKETNYKLPLEFINLLKIQNGGYIRYSLEDIPHEVIYGIGPNLPKIEKPDWSLEKEHVSFKLEGLIPFDGDGHWNLCLDYRESNSKPKITYIDIECDSQSLIANSFNEYLLLLEIDTEKKYVIETNNSTEDTILAISNSLKKKFEEPDSWAHGYPIYRTKYRKEWIWISPNQLNQDLIKSSLFLL